MLGNLLFIPSIMVFWIFIRNYYSSGYNAWHFSSFPFLFFNLMDFFSLCRVFWRSFHSLSSATFGICLGEGFYLPDPCELTFANTLLLSNAAISLGNAFISLEISSQFFNFFYLRVLAFASRFAVQRLQTYKSIS